MKKTRLKRKNTGVYTAKLKAWTSFARFIRSRDRNCVTCGSPTTEAGHYQHNSDKVNKQLGGNMLWYDERNVHGQCTKCNCYGSGNLSQYTLFMIEEYGADIFQQINTLYHIPKKWTIEELQAIAEKYDSIL